MDGLVNKTKTGEYCCKRQDCHGIGQGQNKSCAVGRKIVGTGVGFRIIRRVRQIGFDAQVYQKGAANEAEPHMLGDHEIGDKCQAEGGDKSINSISTSRTQACYKSVKVAAGQRPLNAEHANRADRCGYGYTDDETFEKNYHFFRFIGFIEFFVFIVLAITSYN